MAEETKEHEMTDKEKAKRYDALMAALDFTRRSLTARIKEEESDEYRRENVALRSFTLGQIAVEQEMIELLGRWEEQEDER